METYAVHLTVIVYTIISMLHRSEIHCPTTLRMLYVILAKKLVIHFGNTIA